MPDLIPEPTKEKSTTGKKFLVVFAIVGVVGVGTCGFPGPGGLDQKAIVGAALIVISAIGLVLTALVMFIDYLQG